jgi:predicted small secreted protein
MKTSPSLHSKIGLAALLGLLLGALAFTGCRTMEGAGKDVERAGEKIQEKAR